MPQLNEGIRWFKRQFGDKIRVGIEGTPFTLDLLTAIALQETFYIWGRLFQTMPVDEVLQLCVGDTLDTPNRSAFPKNKAELLSVPGGNEMFAVAREALESMALHVPGYNGALRNPNKFCHGYGIFQYDIQFFKENPSYFLEKRWYNFDENLAVAIKELNAALERAYGHGKTTLTDTEMVYVAIAYNSGRVNFARGFKQGFRDESGKYYGEYIWDYLKLSQTIA